MLIASFALSLISILAILYIAREYSDKPDVIYFCSNIIINMFLALSFYMLCTMTDDINLATWLFVFISQSYLKFSKENG